MKISNQHKIIQNIIFLCIEVLVILKFDISFVDSIQMNMKVVINVCNIYFEPVENRYLDDLIRMYGFKI